MDELELLLHVVHSLMRKRALLLLGYHACVTQLLDVVNPGQLTHHLLVP